MICSSAAAEVESTTFLMTKGEIPPLFGLQEFGEFFYCQTNFAYDRPQSSFGNFFVIRDRDSSIGRVLVPQYNMAPTLVVEFIADSPQSLHNILPREHGEFRHISMISSVMGGGIGSLCFFKLSRYASMASWMFVRASFRVFP